MMKPVLYLLPLSILVFSCKKEDKDPYKDTAVTPPPVINPADTMDPSSFVALHYNIFKPTCANSGCHDGTFEPDYRTIESAYNTLVYQPVIKNSPDNKYQYRVKPGDAENSVLYQRLINDIDGQSGLMPIVDSGNVFANKKEQHLANIRNWINNGAKDMFGNTPILGNLEPLFKGVIGFADNSTTPLPREGGNGSLQVPAAAQTLTLWFSFDDDDTPGAQLGYNKIKFATDPFQFPGQGELMLQTGTTKSGPGYFGENTIFTHKITIDLNAYKSSAKYYFRSYVKDQAADPTEIPKNGSANYVKQYFSFKWL